MIRLLLVRLGKYEVIDVFNDDDLKLTIADSKVFMAARLDKNPISVIKDRRRATPYVPEHRVLEEWVRMMGDQLHQNGLRELREV